MLHVHTVEEALAELTKKTDETWTESMLFDAAIRHGINLNAAPPRTTKVDVWKFVLGEGMVRLYQGLPWELAVMYPQSIIELWQTGETEVVHAARYGMQEGQHSWFDAPVLIKKDAVRVSERSIRTILETRRQSTRDEEPKIEKPLGTRERNAYLRIIGAMLELLKTPRPGRDDDAAIIREMLSNYPEKEGISERNLAAKFAEAKRQLES